VNAAKLCYKYALRYRQSKPGCYDVERAVTKVGTCNCCFVVVVLMNKKK
jgi:hypothetical protein